MYPLNEIFLHLPLSPQRPSSLGTPRIELVTEAAVRNTKYGTLS